MSVETKPFDPALYEEDVEEDDILDEEGENTAQTQGKKGSFQEAHFLIFKLSTSLLNDLHQLGVHFVISILEL